jgi:hypothetical protein
MQLWLTAAYKPHYEPALGTAVCRVPTRGSPLLRGDVWPGHSTEMPTPAIFPSFLSLPSWFARVFSLSYLLHYHFHRTLQPGTRSWGLTLLTLTHACMLAIMALSPYILVLLIPPLLQSTTIGSCLELTEAKMHCNFVGCIFSPFGMAPRESSQTS